MSVLKSWKSNYLSSSSSPSSHTGNSLVQDTLGESEQPATSDSVFDPPNNATTVPTVHVKTRKRSLSPSTLDDYHDPDVSPSKRLKTSESLAGHLPEVIDFNRDSHWDETPLFYASEDAFTASVIESVGVQNTIALFPPTFSSATVLSSFFVWSIQHYKLSQESLNGRSTIGLLVTENQKSLMKMAYEVQMACPKLSFGIYKSMPSKGGVQNTWDDLLKKDVVLLTARSLYLSLSSGKLSLSDAHSLAICDIERLKDAHPQDEIPMVQILEQHYRQTSDPPLRRPRILSLTTIPSPQEFHLDSSLLNLESLLEAKTLGMTDSQRLGLLALPSRPTEVVIHYDSPFRMEDTPLYRKLRALDPSEAFLRQYFKAAKHALVGVGACASDLVWRRALKSIDAAAKPWYEEHDDSQTETTHEQVIKTKARDIIKNWPFTMPVLDPSSKGFNLTPKFIRLLQILRSYEPYGAGFRGIVFVQRRAVALAIVDILRTLEDHATFLRPMALVGHKGSASRYEEIFRSFANGTCNLIVATKSAEDLDMPKAIMVVRFDFFESQVSQAYVLSRTRDRESHVIYLIERSNDTHRRILSQITEMTPATQQWMDMMRNQGQRAMPPPFLHETSDPYHSESDEDEGGENDDSGDHEEPIVDATTGGRICPRDATTVVFRLASKLKRQGLKTTSQEQPLFEFRTSFDDDSQDGQQLYTCIITLPGSMRTRFTGSTSMTIAEARRSACFAVCTELAEVGLLDYSLFPQPDRMVDASFGSSLGSSTSNPTQTEGDDQQQHGGTRCYTRKTPDFWKNAAFSQDGVLYPCIMLATPIDNSEKPHTPISILTRKPLPDLMSFRLFGGNDASVFFQRALPLVVTEEQLQALHAFTLRLSRGVANRALAGSLSDTRYFFAPLAAEWKQRTQHSDMMWDIPDISEFLNWDAISAVSGQNRWARPLIFGDVSSVEVDVADAVIQDRSAEFTRRYTVKAIRGDLTPHSKPEDSIREEKYDSLLHFIKERRKAFEGLSDDNQCIIEVEAIPQVNNLLNPAKLPTIRPLSKSSPKYLIPELCFKYTIPYSILRTALLLPSIMQRVDEYLLVNELNARFFDNVISEVLLHMAIRSPSNNSEHNYERLELLGDAFLKYLSSVYVFVSNPAQTEHAMHMSRQKIISNKALLQHATRAGIPPFIQAKPFPVKMWLPPEWVVVPLQSKHRDSEGQKGKEDVVGVRTGNETEKMIGSPDLEDGEVRDEEATQQDPAASSLAPQAGRHQQLESQSTTYPSTQRTDDSGEVIASNSLDSIVASSFTETPIHSQIFEIPTTFETDARNREDDVNYKAAGGHDASRSASGSKEGQQPATKKKPNKKKKPEEDYTKLWLGDKAVADVAEAIIGAAYIDGGRDAALKVTKALRIPIPNVDRWSDFGRKVLTPPPNLTAKVKQGTIEAVEKIIGREFRYPHLLAQALTHASIPGYEATSYERLEFIGDAILDFLVIRYIFDREQDMDPGGLTLLKGAMVSNAALAALCIWAGLHEHLMFESFYLSNSIEEYVTLIQAKQAEEYEAARREDRQPGQYWLEIEPPKVLSDVVESIIGAMYLSDNFSSVGSEVIFDKLLRPFYDQHVTSSTISHHPTKLLLETFQARGCQHFEVMKETMELQGLTYCQVIVHDVILSAAEDEVAQLAARRASAFGLDALEGDKGFLDRVCNCRERLAEEKKKRKEEAAKVKAEEQATQEAAETVGRSQENVQHELEGSSRQQVEGGTSEDRMDIS